MNPWPTKALVSPKGWAGAGVANGMWMGIKIQIKMLEFLWMKISFKCLNSFNWKYTKSISFFLADIDAIFNTRFPFNGV